jgi:hypothetical protein
MPERRLASKAIAPGDTINVCLMDPYMVLKQNLKTWEIEGYDTIPENVRDSLLYYHSKFIKLISDSSFIATYTNTVREELAKMNVHLFTQDSMSSFLASGGHAYLFNIAQMSVEEYMDPIRKTWALDTSTYWDIWCNAVGINVWYEASVLNDTSKKMQVLFGNMYVRDNINGKFLADFYTGEVKYEYTMDTITLKSVYSLAVRAGKTHAEYIFDYVMNDQMARKAKPGDPPTEYMHYDPVKKTYKKAGIHRFTVVK